MEDSGEKLWTFLECYSKERLLQDLAAIAELKDKPLVTLLLSSGQSVTGHILKYSEDASGPSVLVRLDFTPQWMPVTQMDLFYVESHLIAGITVHDANRHLKILGKAVPRQISGEDKVTQFALKRFAESLLSDARRITGNEQLLLDVDWKGLPNTDGSRLNVRDFLDALKGFIEKSSQDDLGKEAWKSPAGISIRQVAGQLLRCAREGAMLVLSADWDVYLPGDLEDWLNQNVTREL